MIKIVPYQVKLVDGAALEEGAGGLQRGELVERVKAEEGPVDFRIRQVVPDQRTKRVREQQGLNPAKVLQL